MFNYDYYTGEPNQLGSPPQSSSGEISQQEIINNANIAGSYYTNPQQRMNTYNYQPQYYNPSGYGYNNYPQQQNMYYGGYQQQPNYGYYMNPPQQQSGFSGYAGNPAFAYMQQNNMQAPLYNPQPQDINYYIPGFNTGSKTLLRSDAEDVCAQLQMEMFKEYEEAYAAKLARQRDYYENLGYTGGVNYYGMSYNIPYLDQSVTNKYRKKIEDMRHEAEEARTNLNKSLSRLCQNYLNGEVDEDIIDKIYSPHEVIIPGRYVEDRRQQDSLSAMVERDPRELYDKGHSAISQQWTKYFSDDTSMGDFFNGVGQVIRDEKLEEEVHKRKDLSGTYRQDGTYKELIRKKVQENYEKENGITPNFNLPNLTSGTANIPMGQAFPTLNESARLLEDGSLSISAPSWLGNKKFVFKNQMENQDELQRGQFVRSIYGDTPLPSGPPPQDRIGGNT